MKAESIPRWDLGAIYPGGHASVGLAVDRARLTAVIDEIALHHETERARLREGSPPAAATLALGRFPPQRGGNLPQSTVSCP